MARSMRTSKTQRLIVSVTRVTLTKTLLQVHERPKQLLTPYPWGVIWIHPTGEIDYDDEKTTAENVEDYITFQYLPHIRRMP